MFDLFDCDVFGSKVKSIKSNVYVHRFKRHQHEFQKFYRLVLKSRALWGKQNLNTSHKMHYIISFVAYIYDWILRTCDDLWDNLQVTLVTSMLQVEVGECCANNRAEIIEIVVPISKGWNTSKHRDRRLKISKLRAQIPEKILFKVSFWNWRTIIYQQILTALKTR